jgi:uncharacterized protein YggE
MAEKTKAIHRLRRKAVAGEGHDSDSVISSQGSGEVRIVPDSLRADISVEADAATLEQARGEAADKMESVLGALRSLEIENLTLRTQTLQFEPVFRERQPGDTRLPEIIGYRATHSILVTARSVPSDELGDVASQIIDAALGAGATMAGGIGFFVSDPGPARAEALQLAVKDAEQAARAMADAAGADLRAVVSLDGSAGRPAALRTFGLESFAGPGREAARTPIEIGETTISAVVSARYRFAKK